MISLMDLAHGAPPPDCQVNFYPSEEVLLRYYLTTKSKNQEGDFYSSDLIKELDLYDHYPFDLQDTTLVDRVPDSLVLCCLVNKLHQNISPTEIGLGRFSDYSVSAAVRHNVLNPQACEDKFVIRENEIEENPTRYDSEHDDRAAPVSVAQGTGPLRLLSFRLTRRYVLSLQLPDSTYG